MLKFKVRNVNTRQEEENWDKPRNDFCLFLISPLKFLVVLDTSGASYNLTNYTNHFLLYYLVANINLTREKAGNVWSDWNRKYFVIKWIVSMMHDFSGNFYWIWLQNFEICPLKFFRTIFYFNKNEFFIIQRNLFMPTSIIWHYLELDKLNFHDLFPKLWQRRSKLDPKHIKRKCQSMKRHNWWGMGLIDCCNDGFCSSMQSNRWNCDQDEDDTWKNDQRK